MKDGEFILFLLRFNKPDLNKENKQKRIFKYYYIEN